MELTWAWGKGPATTQELADEVEAEGRLITGSFWCPEGRCLWGVIENYNQNGHTRELTRASRTQLILAGLGAISSDAFLGTPEARCVWVARKTRML